MKSKRVYRLFVIGDITRRNGTALTERTVSDDVIDSSILYI